MKKKHLFVLLAAWPALCLGQAGASARISQVLVYPGGATVERVAKVAAGSKELRLSCLPARFEIDSLQVQADTGIVLGEVSVQTVERARAPECATSPLDARIRELQDRRAAVAAESGAQELVLGYLKNYGSEPHAPAGAAPSSIAASVAATADVLRRNALDVLQRQHQLQRSKEEIELQLSPLLAERERLIAANPRLSSVLIRLAAQRDGELRLSYRLNQAGWAPVYRAYLDSAKSQLRLERHAQVAQSSGEDWSGVKLRLSTTQPRQASGLPAPRPWTLDILPPTPQPLAQSSVSRTMALAAPSMSSDAVSEDAGAGFDVGLFQGEYAAEFEVPGRVNLASDGQRVGFALGSQAMDAQVLVRVQPQQGAQAYLLADLARPAGSWPSGSLQLFRDDSFVGQSQLSLGQDERLELFFGQDEMLRVLIEPEQRGGANTGFIGNRAEQRLQRAYVLENLHKLPVTVQVLEASPAPQHEDIRVQAKFNPQPTHQAWKKLPGVVAWQLPLAAGQQLRISADYVISYPKDAPITGLR